MACKAETSYPFISVLFIAIQRATVVVLFLSFLHRITLYLISMSLFHINLTSLLTGVPGPLPIQMQCCRR